MKYKSVEVEDIATAIETLTDYLRQRQVGLAFDEGLDQLDHAASIVRNARYLPPVQVALFSEKSKNNINRCFRILEYTVRPIASLSEDVKEARDVVRFIWNTYIDPDCFDEYIAADKEVDDYIVRFRQMTKDELVEKRNRKAIKKLAEIKTAAPKIKRRMKR